MSMTLSRARLTEILRYKKRIMDHYPLVVEWRKHLGFTRPMARNSKKQFVPENYLIREHMLTVMKNWCKNNIPNDEVDNNLTWDVRQPWIFFENKFRFKFENHKMAFVMEFRCKGDDLKKEAMEMINNGVLQLKGQ